MCNYHCPYADRRACAGFLLCKALYREGINYNDRKNAMTVICAHQKQCMRTGRMENSDEAKKCYESKSAPLVMTSGYIEVLPAREPSEDSPESTVTVATTDSAPKKKTRKTLT